MAGILQAKVTVLEFPIYGLKKLIAHDLNVSAEAVQVEFVVSSTTEEVTGIKVTVHHIQE